MSSKPLHSLVIELPGSPPRHYLLNAASIRLGRVEGNAIVVEEEAVSARHCELRRTASGAYEIRDLGSTNGTRLNGEALGPEARELHEGDTLLLGLAAKARFVRIHEIRDRVDPAPTAAGSVTMRLERPAINPVAAAVAKAAKASAKR
jgi:pSer/pThr/pTyr-binding forkhead associated (FHA) protein